MRRALPLAVLLAAAPALAQEDRSNSIVTITPYTAPDLGRIASGTTISTAVLQPDNTLSISGTATALGALQRTALVKVRCIGTACDKEPTFIRIGMLEGATSGRFRFVNFIVGNLTGGSFVGAPPAPAATLQFALQPLGNQGEAEFRLGITANILPTGNTGTRQRFYAIYSKVGEPPPASGGYSGTMQASILRPMQIRATQELQFGRVRAPMVGSTTISITPAGVAGPPAALLPPPPARSAARFRIDAEGGQFFSLAIPASVPLLRVGNPADQLTLTTTNDLVGSPGSQQMPLTFGRPATFTFNVGGSVPVTAGTPSGVYTGTITVIASYN